MDIINQILEAVKSGAFSPVVGFLALVLFVLSKSHFFIKFISDLKKEKLKNLVESYESNHVDSEFKKILGEEIQKELFRNLAGVYVEKVYREKLFELIKNSDGKVNFSKIKRAKPYMHFENNGIFVKREPFEKWLLYLNYFICVGSTLFSLICLWAALTTAVSNVKDSIDHLVFSALFGAVALFMFYQWAPWIAAKEIKAELDRLGSAISATPTALAPTAPAPAVQATP